MLPKSTAGLFNDCLSTEMIIQHQTEGQFSIMNDMIRWYNIFVNCNWVDNRWQ